MLTVGVSVAEFNGTTVYPGYARRAARPRVSSDLPEPGCPRISSGAPALWRLQVADHAGPGRRRPELCPLIVPFQVRLRFRVADQPVRLRDVGGGGPRIPSPGPPGADS